MVARVVRIENKKLPMKDATKGMQVIGLGDGAVDRPSVMGRPTARLALVHTVHVRTDNANLSISRKVGAKGSH